MPQFMNNLTPKQTLDNLLESSPKALQVVSELKSLMHSCEEQRRLDPETYVKCPRCYGHHSVRGNFDNLCDSCQWTLLSCFPEHDSVPHIKKALEKW